ncbi:MAG: hypothetical protein P794_04115 [Epsilonproteobacteria bacterium (ex Lamellibrachia satsuma)]|nr:MAG: hypothetical protein P794_04115 [Epsilonproteobacteria bacterium (ex Lamellibrachia satsuma)]
MQMVKKTFIVLLATWVALLVFMPKQELYYKLEKELLKKEIKINEKSIEEGLFSLTVKQASVYVKGINVATIEKITFFTLLFYTKIELDSLLLDDSLKAMAPQQTDKAILTYTILSPLKARINAEGSFGVVEGSVDLRERKLHLDFNETKEIGMFRGQLKKEKKGWYYETSF